MSAHSPARCSVVIATLDRLASLKVVLRCLARQTRAPGEVIISAAGDAAAVSAAVRDVKADVLVTVLATSEKSAARQRNQAAAGATGEILAFLDDDIEFEDDFFAQMLGYFEGATPIPGGIAPRITGQDRPPPGRITRLYYRLQSGYADPDYGGRLFGPGINCYPCFGVHSTGLIPAEWLPSTCLFLRADLFRRHQFPAFTGYSFAEDVHLTARVAREAPLFFAAGSAVVHHSLSSEFKQHPAELTAGKLHNMRIIARDVLGRRGWPLWWRWQLHRLFLTAVLVARRPPQWTAELRGVWQLRT
jgi:glycosyltransferase involved in cell wall biosynthesis